jgi:hypothetical protein
MMDDEANTTALARIDPQGLLEKAIEKGADITMLKELVALADTVRAMAAKEAWYGAMARFQAECPQVLKNREANISTRSGGGFKYKYASLDALISTVGETLGKNGLSLSWRSVEITPSSVTAEALVAHRLGHVESSGKITMPIVPRGQDDTGGATPPQRVGIAMTYAKRIAALGILGLAPEDPDDTDGGDGGDGGGMDGRATGRRGDDQEPYRPDGETVIDENQMRKLMAIANGQHWTEDGIHKVIAAEPFGYQSRRNIRKKDFDAICDKLKMAPPK